MPADLWPVWDQVMRIASMVAIPAMIGAMVLLGLSIRKAQALTVPSVALQAGTPLLSLAVYGLFMPVDAPLSISLGLFVVGLVAGGAWSLTTRVWTAEGAVFAKRSVAYLFVWAAAFAVTQFFAGIAWYRWVGYTIPALYLSTGMAVGLNAVLLYRRQQLLAKG